ILRLPPSIRRSIYLFVGLAQWYDFDRIYDLDGNNNKLDSGPIQFHGLLLSCRTIYAEASALLYSSNRFVIRYRQRSSLLALRTLSATSLASLRHVKIVLNETSCHQKQSEEAYGHCCDDPNYAPEYDPLCGSYYGNNLEYIHDPPLEFSCPAAKAMLKEWHSTVDFLSSRVRPKRLELALICDVKTTDGAVLSQVVEPIFTLPALKDLHIRLGRAPDKQLLQVAQDAVLRARRISRVPELVTPSHRAGPYSNSSGSHLLNLPREVRLSILEYTDVVTPWKEVTWSRQHSGYLAGRTHCVLLEWRGMTCPPVVHHGCQFSRCWNTYPPRSSVGCFCRLRHSAISSTCKCWVPPSALFLICRTLYKDAQFVFFSENRFVVHDFRSHPPYVTPPGVYPYKCFAATTFLKEVVPDNCLGYIRFLDIVFPPFSHHDWPEDGSETLQDWSALVNWMETEMNVAGLTLRLVMADISEWDTSERKRMSDEQGSKILAGYMRILGPLSRLGDRGLARFYGDFAWPWRWTEETFQRMVRDRDWRYVESEERKLKERAEKLVMRERYNRLYLDSREPPEGLW
ncbi:hypothetical protein GQ53DRAFT_602156, partial [Thozetella sp. PMI_491]